MYQALRKNRNQWILLIPLLFVLAYLIYSFVWGNSTNANLRRAKQWYQDNKVEIHRLESSISKSEKEWIEIAPLTNGTITVHGLLSNENHKLEVENFVRGLNPPVSIRFNLILADQ